ncbi:hypothetical protein, partial [Acinetobacter baumannii]|uniref:hypothetical protein n=1 Tax=Acinetobacter baumannii TaxID=470 RepID=UPI001C07D203
PLVKEDTHHPALEMVIPPLASALMPSRRRVSGPHGLLFKMCDYAKLTNLLATVDWSFLESATDINAAVSNFKNISSSFLPLCCPPASPPPNPVWADRHLRALRADARRAARAYHRLRSLFHRRIFKYASTAYRIYNRARYK